MKTRLIALIILIAVGTMTQAGCAGKVIVTKVPESVADGKKLSLTGVVYALPRTVIKVSVPLDRTECTKGLYAEYSELFFPEASKGKDFVKPGEDKKVSFKIGAPAYSTIGEPDLSRLYYVELTGHGPVDRTATLDYTEQGIPSGVQGGADNYMTDIIVNTVGAIVGVASRTLFGGGIPQVAVPDTCPEIPGLSPEEKKDREARDKEVYVFFKNKLAPEVFPNYCQLEDNTKTSLHADIKHNGGNANSRINKALAAYKNILTIMEDRKTLITKGTNTPLPSLDLMLKEIDALAARNTASLFTGQKAKETWTPIFELRPSKVNDPPIKLLSINETCGARLIQPLHAQDDPPDGFTATDNCTSPGTKTLQVRFALDGNEQLFQRVQSVYKEDDERSFRYLIPAASLVTLETIEAGNQKVSACKGGRAVIMVAQFGAEVSLPASSGGRSLNYALKYYEATGALKSFGLTSKTAMQAAAVNSFSTSTNALLDAKKKQADDAAAKVDELNVLERKRKILEEQVKIKEYCDKPGITCQ